MCMFTWAIRCTQKYNNYNSFACLHGPLDEHKNITTVIHLHVYMGHQMNTKTTTIIHVHVYMGHQMHKKHNNYNSCACLHGPLDEQKNITTIIHVYVYMGHQMNTKTEQL